MAEVEYRLLGPVEVLRDGLPVSAGGSTGPALLAGLVLSANRVVPGERLAEIMWGDRPPKRPRNALHSAMSRLRRTLGGDAIEGLPTGYRLNAEAGQVDLLRCEYLFATAEAAERRGALEDAVGAVRGALGLWRGRPLGNVDSSALHADVTRLEDKRLAMHEFHADLCLRLAQHTVVAELVPPLVREQPFRERLVGQLMLALFRGGRQTEALAVYASLDASLREELGICPSAWLRDLHVRILRADPQLDAQHPRMSAGVPAAQAPPAEVRSPSPVSDVVEPGVESGWRGLRPPSQSLVGRDAEIEELCRAVSAGPVVTLVGAAGVGKTSVALKAAQRLAGRFRDGVAIVELGALNATGGGRAAVGASAAEVVEAIRLAMGFRVVGEEALAVELRGLELLLVLDNAEHVAGECGRAADLITRSCPEVTVLTTSRRPLGVGAESVVELAPLDPGVAAGLLRLRMRGHRPGIDVSEDPEGVAELCRLVDGLPLAVELAALRLRTMSLRALLHRLGRQRGLLAGPNGARLPHQRAMESTLEWSYELLTRPAQLLLDRLALFAGTFTLEDAERSAGCGPLVRDDVAGLLGSLVEHCLVQTVRGGDGYAYRLLMPVRCFVLGRPAPDGVPAARGSERGAGFHARPGRRQRVVRTSTVLCHRSGRAV